MPHAIEMKDGKLLTPFGIRDLLEAVSDYAGEELAREIEEYIDTNVADIDDYEKEFDRLEQENERLADHYRGPERHPGRGGCFGHTPARHSAEPYPDAGSGQDHPPDDPSRAVRELRTTKHGALVIRTRAYKPAHKYAP